MKKVLAFLLVIACMLSVVACGSDKALTYAEFMAAELESDVIVEAYVQAKQGWWDNKATLYLQDENGGYFAYNATCTQAEYNKIEEGTKVRLAGKKTAWKGEVELAEGATVTVLSADKWIAPVTDVTSLLGTNDLLAKQNMKVAFKGLTVAAQKDGEGNDVAFLYNWDGSGTEGSDSDLYFNLTDGEDTYTFVIEYYLTGADSDAYKAVQALNIGDTVDLEGFLYWYDGAQPHITKVTVK